MPRSPAAVQGLADPPRDCSLLPFWFWNDELEERELLRQIADFDAHGVYGFVIHPRVGLPRHLGWMSEPLLRLMDVAITEAARRDMRVIIYDEGMYPSGASSGQVVAANPDLACRCMARISLERGGTLPRLPAAWEVVATFPEGEAGGFAVVNRPVDAFVRGLHYIEEGPAEDEPPMSDLLNPEATATFIRLVYDGYHQALGHHFGETVIGIFTDEPNALGRCREREVHPGTRGIVPHISRLLGYDFGPFLGHLWGEKTPEALRRRADWHRGIRRRLEETWYAPLHDWCEAHRVALCGHPAEGDEIGVLRHFHIPGQDLVWRWVLPDSPTALEGPESTQGKCSASAAAHLGRRRNSNEFCGAYGHETTFDEFRWLANWCLIRGVNLLIPHAFYYSVRGPRRDERPPQVGPHGQWWDRFKPFADACRRLCWVNAEHDPVCSVAILTDGDHCPWQAAKTCFEHQIDFHYLEDRLLLERCEVTADVIAIAGQRYGALVVEDESLLTPAVRDRLSPFDAAGRVVHRQSAGDDPELPAVLERLCGRDVTLSHPCPGLRVRHVRGDGTHFYLFFNESGGDVDVTATLSARGRVARVDVASGVLTDVPTPVRLRLARHDIALFQVA